MQNQSSTCSSMARSVALGGIARRLSVVLHQRRLLGTTSATDGASYGGEKSASKPGSSTVQQLHRIRKSGAHCDVAGLSLNMRASTILPAAQPWGSVYPPDMAAREQAMGARNKGTGRAEQPAYQQVLLIGTGGKKHGKKSSARQSIVTIGGTACGGRTTHQIWRSEAILGHAARVLLGTTEDRDMGAPPRILDGELLPPLTRETEDRYWRRSEDILSRRRGREDALAARTTKNGLVENTVWTPPVSTVSAEKMPACSPRTPLSSEVHDDESWGPYRRVDGFAGSPDGSSSESDCPRFFHRSTVRALSFHRPIDLDVLAKLVYEKQGSNMELQWIQQSVRGANKGQSSYLFLLMKASDFPLLSTCGGPGLGGNAVQHDGSPPTEVNVPHHDAVRNGVAAVADGATATSVDATAMSWDCIRGSIESATQSSSATGDEKGGHGLPDENIWVFVFRQTGGLVIWGGTIEIERQVVGLVRQAVDDVAHTPYDTMLRNSECLDVMEKWIWSSDSRAGPAQHIFSPSIVATASAGKKTNNGGASGDDFPFAGQDAGAAAGPDQHMARKKKSGTVPRGSKKKWQNGADKHSVVGGDHAATFPSSRHVVGMSEPWGGRASAKKNTVNRALGTIEIHNLRTLPSDLFGISLALELAVRCNNEEEEIEVKLEIYRRMFREMRVRLMDYRNRVSPQTTINEEIFECEVRCQDRMYELDKTIKNDNVEDLLWEAPEVGTAEN